jgi:hypothetical protein
MRIPGRSTPVVPVVPAVFVLPNPISLLAGRSVRRSRCIGVARPAQGVPCSGGRLFLLALAAASPARKRFPLATHPRHGQCAASAAVAPTRCRGANARPGQQRTERVGRVPHRPTGYPAGVVLLLHLAHAAASPARKGLLRAHHRGGRHLGIGVDRRHAGRDANRGGRWQAVGRRTASGRHRLLALLRRGRTGGLALALAVQVVGPPLHQR